MNVIFFRKIDGVILYFMPKFKTRRNITFQTIVTDDWSYSKTG